MYLTVCTIKIDFYSLILENLFSHLAVNNLITSCLNVDEAERISLEQIENHEWLANLQVVDFVSECQRSVIEIDKSLTQLINETILLEDSISFKESMETETIEIHQANKLESIGKCGNNKLFPQTSVDKQQKNFAISNSVKYDGMKTFTKIKQKFINLYSYVKRITNSFILNIILKMAF